MFGSKDLLQNVHSKNIHTEKSYGKGFNIKTFTGKTDTKNFDSNSLMAKDKELKNLTTLNI